VDPQARIKAAKRKYVFTNFTSVRRVMYRSIVMGMAKYADQISKSLIIYNQPWNSVQLPQCHLGGQSAVLKRFLKKSQT
jgi:hypothetical protein